MKISRTTQWILVIGIFAVLLVAAGVVYNRQTAEQSRLSSRIVQAQQELTRYTGQTGQTEQKQELETKLEQARSRIASVQAESSIYTRAKSIEINETLFQAAYDSNVTITSLTSSVAKDENINGITYRIFSLSITAEGEVLPALLNFSKKVSERFSTATITSATIEVTEKPTMNLQVKIYAYEGG